jgi:hypothetical protein
MLALKPSLGASFDRYLHPASEQVEKSLLHDEIE